MQPPQPPKTFKIVPIPVDEDFSPPEGYAMKELLTAVAGDKAVFHAVLVKLPPESKIVTPRKP